MDLAGLSATLKQSVDVWMRELHGYQIITKNMESSKLQTAVREDLNLTLSFREKRFAKHLITALKM